MSLCLRACYLSVLVHMLGCTPASEQVQERRRATLSFSLRLVPCMTLLGPVLVQSEQGHEPIFFYIASFLPLPENVKPGTVADLRPAEQSSNGQLLHRAHFSLVRMVQGLADSRSFG